MRGFCCLPCRQSRGKEVKNMSETLRNPMGGFEKTMWEIRSLETNVREALRRQREGFEESAGREVRAIVEGYIGEVRQELPDRLTVFEGKLVLDTKLCRLLNPTKAKTALPNSAWFKHSREILMAIGQSLALQRTNMHVWINVDRLV